MGLTDGWGGLCLSKVALTATVLDQAAHHTGLNLLKVVRLCADFSLQEADVRLISSLLLRNRD